MEDLAIVNSLFRFLRDRKAHVAEAMVQGSVPDWTIFQSLRARHKELCEVEEALREMVKKAGNDEASRP